MQQAVYSTTHKIESQVINLIQIASSIPNQCSVRRNFDGLQSFMRGAQLFKSLEVKSLPYCNKTLLIETPLAVQCQGLITASVRRLVTFGGSA